MKPQPLKTNENFFRNKGSLSNSNGKAFSSSRFMMPDSPILRRNPKPTITSYEDIPIYLENPTNAITQSKQPNSSTVRKSDNFSNRLTVSNGNHTVNCLGCNTPLFTTKDIFDHAPLSVKSPE